MMQLPYNLKATSPPSDFDCRYDGPQPENITLLRRIYGGPRRWSQVYEVHISSWKGQISGARLGATFVLKLYVLSELTSTDDSGWSSPISDPERTQNDMARREKEAYQKLVGCPVTPKWYGTYEFELPGGEKCMGAVVDYLQGEQMSERYGLSLDGEKLPAEYRVLAAAEALDEIHSRGVAHGDLRTANIILVPGRKNCLQMMFVGFGTATTWTSATKDEWGPKKSAQEDCGELYMLLLKCLSVPRREMRPLLRALPRQGPILKFLEAWDIKATYEEQFEEAIKRLLSFGATEMLARQMAVETVS